MPKFEARAVVTIDGGEPTMWSTTIAAADEEQATTKAETAMLTCFVNPRYEREMRWTLNVKQVTA